MSDKETYPQIDLNSIHYAYVYDVWFSPCAIELAGVKNQPLNIKIPSVRKLSISEFKDAVRKVCENEPDMAVDRLMHVSVHHVMTSLAGMGGGSDGEAGSGTMQSIKITQKKDDSADGDLDEVA